MQKVCLLSCQGASYSCLGPGWALFGSQILKEQEAFSAPKPADRQGALKAPNRAQHRALKLAENLALWE